MDRIGAAPDGFADRNTRCAREGGAAYPAGIDARGDTSPRYIKTYCD